MDENQFFRQATLGIFSSSNIETAMKQLIGFLRKYMQVSGMFLFLYDPDFNMGRFLASIWPSSMQKPSESLHVPKEFWVGARERWFQEPKTTITNDIDLDEPHLRELIRMIWPAETSFLNMALMREKKRLGFLTIFTEGKNRYTDHHSRLISLLHEPFSIVISNILQRRENQRLKNMLAEDNRSLHIKKSMTRDTIIGANFGLRDIMEMVNLVAPMDSPVLLVGETGTGKEVIANAIQSSSRRKDGPFIKVNCGAIPDNLIDSELFGHEKGAFTGAISRKRGSFEKAHNGTIFLDEIGELPLAAQVRLLRVLQQHEIKRVGGREHIPVDVRLISATHRNLEEMVRAGHFREDLWFRINVFPITIPPLRRRTEDIPALVEHFIEQKSKKMKMQDLPSLAKGAIEKLMGYDWPGNVRELENIVEKALILNQVTDRKGLLAFDMPLETPVYKEVTTHSKGYDLILPLDELIKSHIKRALNRSKGRVEGDHGAARMLGLHPSTLRGRMKKLGIPYGTGKMDVI